MTTGTSARTVLLTGGTGLVGSAVIEAITDMQVISLTRNAGAGWTTAASTRQPSASALLPTGHGHIVPASGSRDGVVQLTGDVTLPQLGLNEQGYEALAQSVDVVLHSAGVSDYTTTKRVMDHVNVEGTREVLAFAERAQVPLYHVSTGYIHAQGATLRGRRGAGIYFDSKRAAEQLLENSSSLQAMIRPSIVFGDSSTGWSPSFQGLHRIVALMFENKIPLFPFQPEARVDFLPRDVIGTSIADLVRIGFSGEFWLTAGALAPQFDRLVELLLGYGETLGLELHPPRFVTPDMVERLLKPAGGDAVARRIDLLLALTAHFSTSPELPSSLPDSAKRDLEASFMRGAAYWWQQQQDPVREPAGALSA
jgi:nucleoside-diphosphate-sugar epimerase